MNHSEYEFMNGKISQLDRIYLPMIISSSASVRRLLLPWSRLERWKAGWAFVVGHTKMVAHFALKMKEKIKRQDEAEAHKNAIQLPVYESFSL